MEASLMLAHLLCPAVVERQAVDDRHLPIQGLLLPPQLLLHLPSFLDGLRHRIMII